MVRSDVARCAVRCALALLGAAGACVNARGTNLNGSATHPYVVVVSLDAFRYDYVERFHPPALTALASRGVRSEALIPSFPSKTFPNHYTLVTGLSPGHHGIVGNAFFDPDRGAFYRLGDAKAVTDSSWYGGEPIWVTAERNGVKAAAFFWPGSEAAIGGVRPSYWTKYDGKISNARRVDSAMSWLRKGPLERPHLLLMYFSEVDDSSHKFGPLAPQTALAVASVDGTVRRLVDSLRALPFADSINVVVVSDHGMTETPASQVIPVGDLLQRAGIDTTKVQFGDNGPVMALWFGDDATARRALPVLQERLWNARAYRRQDTPATWQTRENRRAGDLIVVADEGYTLQRRSSDRAPSAGQHGYPPEIVGAMRATFIAAGPNVKALGVIPAFKNVDVYPFLAGLLRLTGLPKVDGSLGSLAGVVR
ncbi:MAG: ectonucleotide pyrophosphatase/phosphodiesterase [Gemmatimonadota bacterium]